MKIESEDIDVESLLEGKFFNIPRFQRPYSWDDENISDLWDDVMSTEGEDYFIGSMVVYRESKQELSVVDGQQRLTTITLLLCALRDAFAALEDTDLAEGLHQLIERKNRSNKNEYVLRTETSFPYLQEKILKYGEADLANIPEQIEEKTLRRADELLTSKVQSLLNVVDLDESIPADQKLSAKIAKLMKVRDSALNLKLILVKLENEDDAYLIFETLNTRGKDLSVTDLAKNLLTKLLKAKGSVDAVKIKWTSILEQIHDSAADIETDAFFYHFWASRHEAIPVKKLYAGMKKKISAKNAMTYLDALVSDAALYRSIHEPTFMWEKNERRVAQSLAAIQLFRVAQPTPALLSLVRAYRDKKLKYARLVEAVEAIEKFHFTYTAVTSSRSSGGTSAMYAAFARRLHESSDATQSTAEIQTLTKKLRERAPSLPEFKLSFDEIVYTDKFTKQKGLVRYILRKFAEHEEFKFAVDWDELTIEHLQPQSSSGGSWDDHDIGMLGNLFLLDAKKNGEIGNLDPVEKIRVLKADGYSIPAHLASIKEWTPRSVRRHTALMAKTAHEKIWRI